MPFKRQAQPVPVPSQPPAPKLLPVSTLSPVMNVLGRGLNNVLPKELIADARGQLANSARATPDHEHLRACIALDWFTRIWLTRWSLLIPGLGEQLTGAMAAIAPIRDLQTAQTAGTLVLPLSSGPDNAERIIAQNYQQEKFYDRAAVQAARQASSTVVAKSAGVAIVDTAASAALDECMAARTDAALKGVAAFALLRSLDAVWPYIQSWANGPGDFEAKQISISALAPVAAEKALEPTTEGLQKEVCGLYVQLFRLG